MKTEKRQRGPRVSTYISPDQKRRIEREAGLRNCDASVVLRSALEEYLNRGLANGKAHNPTSPAIQDALATIVFKAAELFQNETWEILRIPRGSSLEEHINVAIFAERLDALQLQAREIVIQISKLRSSINNSAQLTCGKAAMRRVAQEPKKDGPCT